MLKTERGDLSVEDQIASDLGGANRVREELWITRTWRQQANGWSFQKPTESFKSFLDG
ncbi:MAG TPA: hypothetical protein VF173_21085 [Thermoanaerobaculia bacterium]|nr:hypothetical protein [Thermoanaerobaculia bacterium]